MSKKAGLVVAAALAAASLAVVNGANATTYNLTFTDNVAGVIGSVGPGSFTDYFNFTPPGSANWLSEAAIFSTAISSAVFSLYSTTSGAPTGMELASTPLVVAGPFMGADISYLLTGGDHYFLKLTGDNTDSASLFAVGVEAVPEPATWTMFGLGFAALGVVGLHGRKATRYAL